MFLQIRIVLLLSYLSHTAISTNVHSSCVSSNPVRMVLRSSNESIGSFPTKLLLLNNFPSVLESPGYPEFNKEHACTWKVHALHGGRVKVPRYFISCQKFRRSIDLLDYTTGYCSHHWLSSGLPCFFDVDVRIPDGNFVLSFLFFRIADEGSKVSPSPLKYPGLSHQCNKVRLWKLFFCRFLHRLSGPSNPKPYP